MRIAHFIPAYRGVVHSEVAMGMAREATWCAANGWEHVPFSADCNGIARSRNIAVREAMRHRCDLMLMQDADGFVIASATTQSAIAHLWRSMHKRDAAIVGAVFVVRNGQTVNCEPAIPGEVYDGEVGTGLMLIDLRRLTDLPVPWFVQQDSADGCGVLLGEDIGFCRAVRAAGHRVIVDYSIRTGHASSVVESTRLDV